MDLKYVIGIFSVIGLAGADCPDAWVTFQGSCYHFGHSSLTFQEAEELCMHHKAHLVHIDSAVENTFLKSYMAELKDAHHWIGLKDDVIEGLWSWYDTDTATTFTSWGRGEPNGRQQANCAAIFASFNYDWVDEPCSLKYKALCEKP